MGAINQPSLEARSRSREALREISLVPRGQASAWRCAHREADLEEDRVLEELGS